MTDVTQILNAIDAGDPQAARQLLPLVYDELRRLAAAQMAGEKPGHTLDATALVHEAYLRLVQASHGACPRGPDENHGDNPRASPSFANRRHFFGAAAEAMRRILVENARRKKRLKHGGGMLRRDLPSDIAAAPEPDDDLVALDAALAKLAERYPVHARLVELRYFAGLTGDQAASILAISPATADRHWVFARAWLRRELKNPKEMEDS